MIYGMRLKHLCRYPCAMKCIFYKSQKPNSHKQEQMKKLSASSQSSFNTNSLQLCQTHVKCSNINIPPQKPQTCPQFRSVMEQYASCLCLLQTNSRHQMIDLIHRLSFMICRISYGLVCGYRDLLPVSLCMKHIKNLG